MLDWRELTLGDVLEVKYGKDHKHLEDGDIPLFGSGGIMRRVNKSLYTDESILIPRKGTLNNVIYCNKPFWTVDTMFYTILNSSLIIPKFVFYQLTLIDFNNLNVGSAVPSLTVPVIKEITLTLPPLQEQQAIAEVLSSLDDKIDLLHRNNKTLEEIAETLFRQWFVDDNTEMWSTVGDEFDVVMGQSPPGNTYNENEDGVPFYQGRTDFTLRFPSRRIFCSAPSRMAMAMDTLLSVRAPVGDTNIASEECCIGRGLAAIRHKDKTLHYSYTFLLFNFIKESFDVHEQSGTVFGSISKNELLALKCPRLSEPLMFNEKIAVIEDKVTHNNIQIEALSKLRNTLLPKLMSGTVRVKH